MFNWTIYTVILLAFLLASGGYSRFLGDITKYSAKNALMGATIGVGGFLFFTLAMRSVPNEKAAAIVILITGLYAVTAMVAANLWFDASMNPRQWIGVAVVGLGLVVVNWK